ncbi:MAG: isochorismatase family protein [Variibacter sp.]
MSVDPMTQDWSEVEAALEKAFSAAMQLYNDRGFAGQFGFGRRPAVITIDLANAWTRPGNVFTCDQRKMNEEIIPGVQRLQKAARANGHPVIHVTTAYQNTNPKDPNSDLGIWPAKSPLLEMKQSDDNELWKIDSRIAPVDGERVIIKKNASGFAGTDLHNYLTSIGVDTVLITGVTASCCVRATVQDALANGFRPVAVKECVGDRIPAAVQYNLFDINAKLGDVRTVDECVNYLSTINTRNI